jgi:urease accessory protein
MANRFKKSLLAGAALLCVPALAQAHNLPGGGSGLATGFTHPLLGWDHLLVMLAVGVWAAQLGGRALWRIPLVFASVMLLGATANKSGAVPAPENAFKGLSRADGKIGTRQHWRLCRRWFGGGGFRQTVRRCPPMNSR